MARIEARVDTIRHRVGQCPACREYLWAEVTVNTYVGDPTLNEEGYGYVNASAEPVAMQLNHSCFREDDR